MSRIAKEEPLNVIVDGKPCDVLMRTPGDDKNLVRGFLYSKDGISCLKAISSKEIFSSKNLSGLDKKLAEKQKMFKLTGGTHAAGLFDKSGKLILLKEDVSRHNALDKVIGCALGKKIDCHDKIVFLSGRTSYEIVLKVIRLGAPVVASISGTTSSAIDLSKEFSLTLIGFLRGKSMTVYTHKWRLDETENKRNG